MFHSVDFISCHVINIFAYGDPDSDTIYKFHHRVIPGVSQLYVIDHQLKVNRVEPRKVAWGMPLLMSINSVIPQSMTLSFLIQKGNDP